MRPADGGIIDAWAQPPLPQLHERVPEAVRLLRLSGADAYLDKGITIDQMVEEMDAAGIAVSLLSAWCRPGRWVITNDEVADIVRRHPTRFRGIAAVDLERPVEAVRELERAVRKLDFVGLRVVPWIWRRPPNDKLFFPLYVKCIELDIPFCTQVGHTGPLMPSETGRPIPYVDEVALTFPELRIVGGHIGYPWCDEMISLAWKHENVYIDTSAYIPKAYPSQLVGYMRGQGRSKVLFGTNYPQLSLAKCVSQLDALSLQPDVHASVVRNNAQRVFKL